MRCRLSRWIFLTFALLYVCTTRGHFIVVSEVNDFQTTRALWEQRNLQVGWVFGSLAGRGGARYSQHPIGQSVAAVPLYGLARGVKALLEATGLPDWIGVFAGPPVGAEPTRWGGDIEIFFVNLFNAFVTAALCAVYFRFARDLGVSPRNAAAAAVLLGLTTYVAPLSTGFLTHPSDSLLLLLALYALVRNASAPSGRARLAAGTFIALMLQVRLAALVAWPALFAYFAWSVRQHAKADGVSSGRALRRELPAVALPVLVGIGLHFAVTWLKFGAFWVELGGDTGGFRTPLLVGLFGFLFSPGASVLLFTPLLVLTPWLQRFAWRRRRAETATCLAIAASFLVVCAKYTSWHGLTDTVGPRYLSPLVPLLLLPLPAWLDAQGRRGWRLVAPLAVAGLAVQVLQIAVNFSYVFHFERYADYQPPMSFLFIPQVSPLVAHWNALRAFDYRVDMWLLNVYRGFGLGRFALTAVPLLGALALCAWRLARAVQAAPATTRPTSGQVGGGGEPPPSEARSWSATVEGLAPFLRGLAVVAFGIVVLRTAWLCDDAYISFRTADNVLHGYGLRWNVAERVQTYTHPLWLFLVTAAYGLTGEVYFTALAVSILLSLAAVALIAFRAATSVESAVFAVAVLGLSRTFVDYSTSGLETPLTYLLLTAFGVVYLGGARTVAALRRLALLSALCALNRLDVFLVVLPALAYAVITSPPRGRLRALLPGALLLLAWEAFAVFYYGFPFPNTAYAKLQTGISRLELLQQGAVYCASVIVADPVTAAAIVAGLAVPFSIRRYDLLPLTGGILLYVLYVVTIGGDYMLGRFFTPPLVLSAVMLSLLPFREHRRRWMLAVLAIVGLGLTSSRSPLYSDASYGSNSGGRPVHEFHGVSDERAFYYPHTGLLRAFQPGGWPEWPTHRWVQDGRIAHSRGPHVVFMWSVGLFGFYAGPAVHVIDPLALGDPLLARLPAEYNPDWFPGHFTRTIPAGYYETLATGRNVIEDRELATYYDKLALVTRGALLDPRRLAEIWNFNTGKYAHLVRTEAYRFPPAVEAELHDVSAPKTAGTRWNQEGNIILRYSGVDVRLPQPSHARMLEVSLDHNDDYEVVFVDGGREIARRPVAAHLTPEGGLAVHVVDVPQAAVDEGYEAILIRPRGGDNAYSLGHLRLLE